MTNESDNKENTLTDAITAYPCVRDYMVKKENRIQELEEALHRACDMISDECCSHISKHGPCRAGLKQCCISEFLALLPGNPTKTPTL